MALVYQGYCLARYKQGESNLVVHLLTEEGVIHFIVRGAFRPKAKIKQALFIPLAKLECTLSQGVSLDLKIAKQVTLLSAREDIILDMAQAMQRMLMGELAVISCRQGIGEELFKLLSDLKKNIQEDGVLPIYEHLYFIRAL